MTSQKIEVELTQEQADKVEILKSKGISVGEAIDMLFEIKEKVIVHRKEFINESISDAEKQKKNLENQLSELENYIALFTKLNDDTIDIEQKQKILEKTYFDSGEESYEITVQRAKHNISWAKDFFKF